MAASEVTVPATPTRVAGSRENGTAADRGFDRARDRRALRRRVGGS